MIRDLSEAVERYAARVPALALGASAGMTSCAAAASLLRSGDEAASRGWPAAASCVVRPLRPWRMTARACERDSPASCVSQRSNSRSVGVPVREGPRLDVGDARLGQQREGDDGDLPQVDLGEAADAGLGVAAALHGAEADGEAVERAGAHEARAPRGRGRRRASAGPGRRGRGHPPQMLPDADRLGSGCAGTAS